MKKTIDERFSDFHEQNPHIYKGLLRLARQFKEQGRGKIGISLLVEVMRWNNRISTVSMEDFKITNDFKPLYARMIMKENPELEGIFILHPMWRKDRSNEAEVTNPYETL